MVDLCILVILASGYKIATRVGDINYKYSLIKQSLNSADFAIIVNLLQF